MAELTAPDLRFMTSFLEAMAEFSAEGRGGPHDDSVLGLGMRRHGSTWTTAAGFRAFLEELHLQEAEGQPAGLVPSSTFWWVEGQAFIGRVSLRHRLNGNLLERGGHIGYDVRPTARRLGHATAMLAATLKQANCLGIDPALITCLTQNVASRRVIEANRGELEDERQGMLRFWVPTHPAGD